MKLKMKINVEVEKVILEDNIEMEKDEDEDEVKNTILEEDAVCDAMAPSVGSSYNSSDVKKQDEVAAGHEEEVVEVPGGNIVPSCRSPRFGHTKA